MHDHDILGKNNPICDALFINNKEIWQTRKRINLLLQIHIHYLGIVLFTGLQSHFFFMSYFVLFNFILSNQSTSTHEMELYSTLCEIHREPNTFHRLYLYLVWIYFLMSVHRSLHNPCWYMIKSLPHTIEQMHNPKREKCVSSPLVQEILLPLS